MSFGGQKATATKSVKIRGRDSFYQLVDEHYDNHIVQFDSKRKLLNALSADPAKRKLHS